MLKDLRTYDNLGSPQYFFELFKSLNNNNATIYSKRDLEQLFYNRNINGRSVFDGCLDLAFNIGVLLIDDTNTVSLNKTFQDFLLSEKQMCDKFVEYLFLSLKDDNEFQNIFSSKNISYDVIYHSVQITYGAFGLKYASFKQLLIDFEIIKIHPTTEIKKFIINSRYKKLFDKTILPEIKRRKIGIEEFQLSLEQQQIYGEEAEKFVLKFEHDRLNGNKTIDWVAEYSVAEGYDIASFNNELSIVNDRFIEVKSFSGRPYFFWSRNEIDIARIKKGEYYLYLVDRDKMNNIDYTPLIIQNPYVEIYNNEANWDQRIEKIRFAIKGG
ncbi:DUF3883 domain-containing protein [Mucilaginibacter calamicampi]|uniref:DUF3883 domain-containing protein n=1 Tax=Mucilaginibacter calamicampi TaxID=1302352 RepID=A0ABW2YUY6_9SPHI